MVRTLHIYGHFSSSSSHHQAVVIIIINLVIPSVLLPSPDDKVYAFMMNGVRLGTFQPLVNVGFTTRNHHQGGNETDFRRTVMAGAIAGSMAGAVASPLYMVRRQDTTN